MDMTEYKPNSYKSREEAKEQKSTELITNKNERKQKVISGTVKTKKNDGRKLADIFFSEDVPNIKNFLFKDILIPGVKSLLTTMFHDGVDMLFYGRSGGSSGSRSVSTTPKVSYRKYYEEPVSSARSNRGYEPRSRFDYEDIVFQNRGQAEIVRRHMFDTLDRYGMVTVLDMYDFAGAGGDAPHTASNYGWTSIRNADIKPTRDGGYIIDLPRAMPID